MADPPPGYLLPEGECYTDDLACTLVFYPDKEEYRRALLGSITYLSTWLAWERDSGKRGKDAARAWKNAVDETLECWTMACFEELIADVARIRDLLETKKDCCDGNVTYYPTEEPSTEIEPGVGDPPDFYGETAVSDWEDWEEHVCFNAHAYVDFLISTGEQLFHATQVSSIFLGVIAAALALLAFSGIGLPIAFGLAASVVSLVALSATALTFADTDTDFEDARESIVCAIVKGYSLPDAVESALGSDSSWDLFYQFVDYTAALAIIYEGGYGTEYLPAETRDDCACVADAQFIFTWDDDLDSWSGGGPLVYTYNAPGKFITATPNATGQWKHDEVWDWVNLGIRFGFGLPVQVDQIRFRFYNNPDVGAPIRHLFYFKIYGSSPAQIVTKTWDTDDYAPSQWHYVIWDFPEPLTSNVAGWCIWPYMYRYSPVNDLQRVWFDDWGLFRK